MRNARSSGEFDESDIVRLVGDLKRREYEVEPGYS
jgi:hypothetical protein